MADLPGENLAGRLGEAQSDGAGTGDREGRPFPGLSSGAALVLVLAADDPAALARFYGAVVGVAPCAGFGPNHWRVPWTACGLEIYAPSRARPQPRQMGRLALALQRPADGADPLRVVHRWVEAIQALGACPLDPPRLEAFGAEAWLLDPEGNRLLLVVLA